MQIPCPAYQLGKISQSQQIESEAIPPATEEKVSEPAPEDKVTEPATSTKTDEPTNVEVQPNEQIEAETPATPEPIVQEPIVQEPSVSSI